MIIIHPISMELEYSKNKIVFNRELSNLDKLVLRFCTIMHRLNIRYVIISGYIAILFGRSRETEDVDLFIERISYDKMNEFWKTLDEEGFEGVSTFNSKEAFETLSDKTSIRFALKGTWKPNFEIKFVNTPEGRYSLDTKILVVLNGEEFYTSEIEMQIAYKMWRWGEKDLEDSVYLYTLFKEKLNTTLLYKHLYDFNVPEERVNELWKE